MRIKHYVEFVNELKSNVSKEDKFDKKKVDVKLISPFYEDSKLDKIDILIADTIRILNEKGIETIACCSGHISDGEDSKGYLWIKDNIDIPQYVADQCCKIKKDVESHTPWNNKHNNGTVLYWDVESLEKNKERMKVFERWAKSL